MAYPRTPLAVAKATGSALRNPKRFKDRSEPSNTPLGEPSRVLKFTELEVWEAFKREFPYLMESDRTFMENLCIWRARVWNGCRDQKLMRDLNAGVRELGGTPAARTKVHAPEEQSNDPAEAFFN